MSGLVLKLSPKERVLVNGVVIENGERRSRLSILTPDANILRLRDAIHPSDAKTPVKRLCFAVQLVLSGDKTPSEYRSTLLEQIEDLSQVFTDADSRSIIAEATRGLVENQHYRVLKSIRALIPREERLLSTHHN